MSGLIQRWMEQVIADRPDQLLFIQAGREITYLQARSLLAEKADSIAQLSIEPGQRVLITTALDSEALLTLTALMMVGAVPVPVTSEYPHKGFANLAAQLPPPVHVLVRKSDRPASDHTDGSFQQWDYQQQPSSSTRSPRIDKKGRADLVVLTSGSSGSPKAVRITNQNLSASIAATQEQFGFPTQTRWHLQLPIHHIGGLMVWFRCLALGGTLTFGDPSKPSFPNDEDIAGWVTSIVPTQLHRILSSDPGDHKSQIANSNGTIFVGGGSTSPDLISETNNLKPAVFQTYGATETTSMVAVAELNSANTNVTQNKPHFPVEYTPLPGVAIDILDRLVQVSGAMVSPGYEGQSDHHPNQTIELSDRAQRGGSTQRFRILGRSDRTIISGGKNIDPTQIEVELNQHPDVDQAVVLGVHNQEWGQIVVAAYVGQVNPDQLHRWCSSRLVSNLIPKRWLAMQVMPLTSLGKVDYDRLAKMFSSDHA